MKKEIMSIATLLIISMSVLSSVAMAADPGTVPADYVVTEQLNNAPLAISPKITETGKISLSIDGLGTNDPSGIIQVEKPAGATVRKAFMAAASVWSNPAIPDGAIKIDGADVIWSDHVSLYTNNHWADVTSIVKSKIDAAAAGRVDFTITEANTYAIDGEILAVIFDDPSQTTDNTVVLLFGAQKISGDDFAIGLANPIDLTDPNLGLDFSLGISFGYQTFGGPQRSLVDVNGVRLTSSAGGQDDGVPITTGNGGLLTVGGLDDSNANPPDPNAGPTNPRTDDELYNLLPFVNNGDTIINVHTVNPSNDDNIFFAALNLKSAIAIVGEGILLSPTTAINIVGEEHTVTATVQDDLGNPIVGRDVTFTIVSGPHAGLSEIVATDVDGKATFTYTGTSVGTDVIVASFVNNDQKVVTSNEVTKEWKPRGNSVPEFPTIALPIVSIMGILFLISRRKKN